MQRGIERVSLKIKGATHAAATAAAAAAAAAYYNITEA